MGNRMDVVGRKIGIGALALSIAAMGCGDASDGGDGRGQGGDGDGSAGLGNPGTGGFGGGTGATGGGTGATGGGDGDGSGGGGGGEDCGNVEITPMAEFSPGNILMIFDRSLSMNSDFNGMSRFDAANVSLLTAIDPFTCKGGAVNPDGTPCSDPLTVATILFPQNGGSGLIGQCTMIPDLGSPDHISWMKSTDWIPAWMAYWNNHALELGTPIIAAFETADRALAAAKNGMPALDGNTAIIFVTDGEGTCNGATTEQALAGQWAAEGINTYVINVNANVGGAGAMFNDQVAAAGNTGSSINPGNQAELQAAMQMIMQKTASIASCDITLTDGALGDLQGACERGDVTLGPNKLACDSTNGFQVTGASQMELFGTACDELMAGGILHASFPCDVVLVE